jgi:dTMP kinase
MPFIAFEGLDGSGKSTLINGLKHEFEQRRIQFVITREPGGTVLGDEIRQMLLRVKGEAPVARAEALLYQAGRAQHVEKLIRPALADKKWVLSDRFDASSIAFQGGGRDLSRAQLDWLNDFSTAGVKPDLNVLLDLSVDESLKRLARRGDETDRFEREARDFHERVRKTYLELAASAANKWLVLQSNEPPPALLKKLIETLKERTWLA